MTADSAAATTLGRQGRWQRFWFPPSTTVGLSVCRILAALTLVLFFLPDWETQVWVVGRPGFEGVQGLVRLVLLFVSEQTFRSESFLMPVYWAAMIGGWLAVVGLFTRPAVFVAGLASGLMQAHEYSYGRVSHPEAIFCLFLVSLAFAPCNRCFSLDAWIGRRRRPSQWGTEAVRTDAVWPLRLAQLMIALAYLSAAVAKMVVGGVTWINGYTLQTVLLRTHANYRIRDPEHLQLGKWLCEWMMTQYELLVAMSIGTLVVEGLFFVAVFSRRLRPWFLLGGVGLHISIWLVQNAPFHEWMVLYATFLNWDWIRAWFRRGLPEAGLATAAAKPVG